MQAHDLEFYATYRYPDRRALDRALAKARAELGDGIPVRWSVREEAILTVDVALGPARDERLAAANVFLILAHGAVEGVVERGQRRAA